MSLADLFLSIVSRSLDDRRIIILFEPTSPRSAGTDVLLLDHFSLLKMDFQSFLTYQLL